MDFIVNQNYLKPNELEELLKKVHTYETAALSINTSRTYAVMWKKFEKWCETYNLNALPTSSDTISLFLTSLAGTVSFSTIDLAIAAIEKTHEQKCISITGDSAFYRRVRKVFAECIKRCRHLNKLKPCL